MTERKQIKEYDILRVIVTLLVIVGHCVYASIETNSYGLWDYSAYTESGLSIFYRLAGYAVALIYTVHMPLYMMLSGALYKYAEKLSRGGYGSFRILCEKKAKNLLIPFFVVTLCYVTPLKYFSGYYAESRNILKDIFVGQLLLQGNNHLWFLPVLFIIFLLVYLMDLRFPSSATIKLAILFVAYCFSDLIPVALIRLPLNYAFWFYTGCCFEGQREKINYYIEQRPFKLAFVTGLWVILAAIISKLIPSEGAFLFISKLSRAICALIGCYAIYGCSYLLAKTNLSKNTVFMDIRKNTLGLYLYSDPLNYVILFLAVQWFGGSVFSTDLGALCLCSARFFITATVAYGVSYVLRKCRIKYLC